MIQVLLAALVLVRFMMAFEILHPTEGSSFQRGSIMKVSLEGIFSLSTVTVVLNGELFCEINDVLKDTRPECVGIVQPSIFNVQSEIFALGLLKSGQVIRSNIVHINVTKPPTPVTSRDCVAKKILQEQLKAVPECWRYKIEAKKLALFDVDGTLTDARKVNFELVGLILENFFGNEKFINCLENTHCCWYHWRVIFARV